MNNLPYEYIDNAADDNLPCLDRTCVIHIYRRKAYGSKAWRYNIGSVSYGYENNLSLIR